MRYVRLKAVPVAALAALLLLLAACDSGESTDDTGDTGQDVTEESDDEGSDDDNETSDEAPDFAVPVKSTGDPYADAKTAAGHVEGSAEVLSGGLATATDLGGDTASQASELRATLSSLLQEHVYLSGYAVDAAYSFGADSQEFELAEKALDENSVELADLIGSAAGEDNRDAFLELWRQHIGFFVDYAVAQKQGDEQARQQALDDLQGYKSDSGAFFEQITGGELPASAVEESFQGHIDTLTTAIDSLAAGDASAFDDTKAAADYVVDNSAKALAGGVAAAIGAEGDVNSEASQLRTGLATGLQEHVYLAGLAVKTAYAEGADSPAFEAATGTLDTNSVELADGIGQLAGDENREAFLNLWRNHIGFFVDYAVATAENDQDGQAQAISDLEGYTGDAGAFFEEISAGELPADAVSDSLREHISTLAGAIDSLDAAINK